MSKTSSGFDAEVLIGGGGLVGQTLALALDSAGVSVAVVDAAKPSETLAPHFDGRAFAIAFASYRMWRALGLAEALDPVAQPIREIMVTDGRPGGGARKGGPSLLHLHFDGAELSAGGDDEPLGLMLEARHLRLALDQAVRARPSIKVIAPMALTDFERDAAGVTAILADGRRLRANVLIGADGRRSFVRERCGIRTIGRDYKVTAIVATVTHERPHNGVAHEYFLPNGPFAILPLKGERANIVWAEPHAAADVLLKMNKRDFLAELERRFGSFLGALDLEGPRFGYPLTLQLAERMIDARVALAGDSAHGIHPIAGQGLNLGLKDVAALAECISDGLALGLDAGDVSILERYQRWRRFDNITMALGMEFFDRLFSNDIRPLRAVRDLGLAAVNAAGPARRFFMRYAGGAAGDLPKLLRGEKLAA
ncbi:MAG TPA: UbiH/UbiF/VisC/COQ6 family ubiquinone biosynthesis hydroxylase [Caulobacterales bacterium]|nr:UbiH/UbiF/VisC/COQ6 family ubiquinone biosynthesis hydroxylase [Caulobacterales bacterium]